MANTTWNPSDKSAGCTLSGGNLIASFAATNNGVRSVDRLYSGKYYWEVAFTTRANLVVGICLGVSSFATLNAGLSTSQCATVGSSGSAFVNNISAGNIGGTFVDGWVLCISLDATNNLVWFRNGAAGNWNGSGTANPATGVGGTSIAALGGGAGGPFGIYACAQGGGGGGVATANFGASGFAGAVPAGFNSGFPDSTTLINADVLTQIAIEQWAAPIPPQMQATQLALEMWGGVPTTNTQMLATLMAVEQWASVREASRGGPMITTIM